MTVIAGAVRNTDPKNWCSARVPSRWPHRTFSPAARWGQDLATPIAKQNDGGGWAGHYAPARDKRCTSQGRIRH